MSYTEEQDEGWDLQDAYDEEIADTDYGFVLDADGNLKSVFVPAEMMEVPERVLTVFKILGIDNPHTVYVHTVH